MDDVMIKLLSGKLIYMIAHFNAIDWHKVHESERNNLLNVLNVQIPT